MQAIEMTDVVDAHDRPVGKKERQVIPDDFVNVRYVAAFIVSEAGELWIPRRRTDKARWPGGLDAAMGGAVNAGEEYLDAAVREIKEEVGLDVKPDALHEIAYLSPYKFPIACFLKVYELRVDRKPHVTDEEYAGAKWYKVSDLIAELNANREPNKADLLPVVRLCYGAMRDADRSQFSPKQ